MHQVKQAFELPDLVKKAEAASLSPPQRLPAYFGDPVRCEFPCHAAPATLLSAADLMLRGPEKVASYERIYKRLRDSATHQGAAGEFKKLAEQNHKRLDTALEALPDECFALVLKQGEKMIRQYPLRNADEVKAAADYLKRFRGEFRFEDRHKIASRILQRAVQLGAGQVADEVPLLKTAAVAVTDAGAAAALLRKAARLTKGDDRLTKLADQIERLDQITRDAAIKVADVVDNVYLDAKVKPDLLPEDELFLVTPPELKTAAAALVPFGGEMFHRGVLVKFGRDKAAALIGDRAHALYSPLPITPRDGDGELAATLRSAIGQEVRFSRPG